METARPRDLRRVLDEFLEWKPHLVLMDVGLPFFDGYHWCREIPFISIASLFIVRNDPHCFTVDFTNAGSG